MEKPDDLFMIEMDMDMRELEADIDMNSNQMQDVKAQNGRYKKNSNVRLISQKPRGGFNTDKGLQAVLMRLQAPDDSGKGYLAPLGGDGGYGGSSDDVLQTSLSPPRERHRHETGSTTGTRDSGCSSAEGSADDIDHLGLPEEENRPPSRQSQSTDLSSDETDTSSDDTPSFTEFTRV
ncbi:uncharacterized protein [Amphiura filiformis]|uniref:uncharacterized protein n=1 Tax=Amphiura filiformis TaxID=82378 RepID=UPI003B22499A